jgi:hypothetical protein
MFSAVSIRSSGKSKLQRQKGVWELKNINKRTIEFLGYVTETILHMKNYIFWDVTPHSVGW